MILLTRIKERKQLKKIIKKLKHRNRLIQRWRRSRKSKKSLSLRKTHQMQKMMPHQALT